MNEYIYKIGTISAIANCYDAMYEDGLTFLGGRTITDLQEVADFHGDFDRAYRSLSYRMQRFIDRIKAGYDEEELERMGYYDIGRYKHLVYQIMADYLNGGNF